MPSPWVHPPPPAPNPNPPYQAFAVSGGTAGDAILGYLLPGGHAVAHPQPARPAGTPVGQKRFVGISVALPSGLHPVELHWEGSRDCGLAALGRFWLLLGPRRLTLSQLGWQNSRGLASAGSWTRKPGGCDGLPQVCWPRKCGDVSVHRAGCMAGKPLMLGVWPTFPENMAKKGAEWPEMGRRMPGHWPQKG